MTSTMGCVGLAVASNEELGDLVARMLPHATSMGAGQGFEHYRWTDASGARLTLLTRGGRLDYALPSYAGPAGAHLGDLAAVAQELATADVLDADGEQTTRLAVEVEQMHFLPPDPVTVDAAVTAFGLAVTVHADEAAYYASDDSLLDVSKKDEPPPANLPAGIAWPTRMGAESFISYGVFGDPAEAQPHARLTGPVQAVATHTVALTGQSFHVVRTSVLGMALDVCLAAIDHPPPPLAGIVSGTVYLVASADSLWPPQANAAATKKPRRSWFGRR